MTTFNVGTAIAGFGTTVRCCERAEKDPKSPQRYMRDAVHVPIEKVKPELEKIYARYHPDGDTNMDCRS